MEVLVSFPEILVLFPFSVIGTSSGPSFVVTSAEMFPGSLSEVILSIVGVYFPLLSLISYFGIRH